jgi:phosphate starvation-inducible PhoH-like protein
VVRHNLVQRIVRAYERYNQQIGASRQLSLKLSGEPETVETVEPEATGETAPPV